MYIAGCPHYWKGTIYIAMSTEEPPHTKLITDLEKLQHSFSHDNQPHGTG